MKVIIKNTSEGLSIRGFMRDKDDVNFDSVYDNPEYISALCSVLVSVLSNLNDKLCI